MLPSGKFLFFFFIYTTICEGSTLSAINYKVALIKESTQLICAVNISRWDSVVTIIWQHEDITMLRHNFGTFQEKRNKYISVISQKESSVTLEILNITYKDAGMYTCLLYFEFGKPEKVGWTLQIQGRPHLLSTEIISKENETTSASCCVKFAFKPNHSELHWVLGGSLGPSNDFSLMQNTFNASSLNMCRDYVFQSHRHLHGAVLECLVENELNISVSTAINIKYSPTVSVIHDFSLASPLVFLVLEGKTVNISCECAGNPEPKVSLQKRTSLNQWRKAHMCPIYTSRQGTLGIYTFALSNVSLNVFTGTFRCSAVNEIGEAASKEFLIELEYSVDVITINSSTMKFKEGDDIMIWCTLHANPLPQVKLQRKIYDNEWASLSLQETITTKDFVHKFTFVFVKVKKDLAGKYRCSAKETMGEITKSESITLEYSSAPKSFAQLLVENIWVVIVVCLGLIVLLFAVLTTRLKDLLYANVSYFPTEPNSFREQDYETVRGRNTCSLPSVTSPSPTELLSSQSSVPDNSNAFEERETKEKTNSREDSSAEIYTYVTRI